VVAGGGDAGDDRAVAVAVALGVVDDVGAGGGAALELGVGDVDAGVQDVDRHAGAVGVGPVGAVEREQALVDAVQAPALGGTRRDRGARAVVGLGEHGAHVVGFDGEHAVGGEEAAHLVGGQVGGEAGHRRVEHPPRPGADRFRRHGS
jgi:hypothetical protein